MVVLVWKNENWIFPTNTPRVFHVNELKQNDK